MSSVRDVEREFHLIGLPLLRLTYCKAFRVRQSVALAGTHQLPPQLFACSLKLLKRVGVEGRSEKKGRRRVSQKRVEDDTPEENETRDNAGTHTNTEGRRQTHRQINVGQHSAGFLGPESSCLPVQG